MSAPKCGQFPPSGDLLKRCERDIGHDGYHVDSDGRAWRPETTVLFESTPLPERVHTGNPFRDAMANNRGIHTNS